MKRDMDLIREILLKIEEHDVNSPSSANLEIEGYSPREVYEHARLLENAGLIEDAHFDFAGNTWVQRITWSGYDYLDKVRDNSIWKKRRIQSKKKGYLLFLTQLKRSRLLSLLRLRRASLIPLSRTEGRSDAD